MEIEKEPEHGFTTTQIYNELKSSHPGAKNDLLKILNPLKDLNPDCFKQGKYWGTPANKI